MRKLLLLLLVSLLGCASTDAVRSHEQASCAGHDEDQCVTLLCGEDACGFYRCEDMTEGIVLSRFPPARPPAAAAAPGSGPRRNWGNSMDLPGGREPVMVFPWYPEPKPAPPRFRLPAGRFEKHHIFPQARDLAEWFSRQGVWIHDYTLPIPVSVHRRIHSNGPGGGQWNQAWRDFMEDQPLASPEAIFKHAGELIYRFQLLGGPSEKYF